MLYAYYFVLLHFSLGQLAVKSAPTKQEFLQHLAVQAPDAEKATFEQSVVLDMDSYIKSLDVIRYICS